jgi:hypothetical protein
MATADAKSEKWRDKLRKLHALMGSDNASESEAARRKILEMLAYNKKTWNDLPALLAAGGGEESLRDPDEPPDPPWSGDTTTEQNPFDLVCSILQEHLHLKHSPEFIALALWAMHTHVFDRFAHTPRLALLSPVRGCGKTAVLEVLEQLVMRPVRFDHTTAAAAYRIIDGKRPALLFDEFDNQELNKPGPLRAVLNSGHGRKGVKMIVEKGQERRFSTFAPAAFATIGALPLPLMHRSIVIRMERAPHSVRLKRFDSDDESQQAHFGDIYAAIFRWARQVKLDRDPAMPAKLHNRRADNWRVLLAIADACGRGDLARKAALEMSREHQDEDAAVELLRTCAACSMRAMPTGSPAPTS